MDFATTLFGFTIGTIWAVIILAFWIAFAFWPARVASRKGHSFWGYFIFSIFFFVIALVVAYVVPNRTKHSTKAKAEVESEPAKPSEE